MSALDRHGLPVPKAIDNNRHAVLMSLIDASPLAQVSLSHEMSTLYRPVGTVCVMSLWLDSQSACRVSLTSTLR